MWYGFGMDIRQQANGEPARRRAARIPTTPPHPVPGGEYDRDGFLHSFPVENMPHEEIRSRLRTLLAWRMQRGHGHRALIASDCGMYARPADKHAQPLAPDILVSLTAGALGTPGTPAIEDRLSYKLWQEPVPDFVLEIVSKSTGKRDIVEKPARYEAMGIPECWIFDPLRYQIEDGLQGHLLVGDRYRHAHPRGPRPDEVPLPPGAVGYWSEALGLHLYVDGRELVLHDPETGPLKDLAAETANREAAEERASRESVRADRESARADREAARVAALEAELRTLRQRSEGA